MSSYRTALAKSFLQNISLIECWFASINIENSGLNKVKLTFLIQNFSEIFNVHCTPTIERYIVIFLFLKFHTSFPRILINTSKDTDGWVPLGFGNSALGNGELYKGLEQ